MAGQSRISYVTQDIVEMRATAPYFKLSLPHLSYEVISAKVLQANCKMYGKCAGSQLPIFYLKMSQIFNIMEWYFYKGIFNTGIPYG